MNVCRPTPAIVWITKYAKQSRMGACTKSATLPDSVCRCASSARWETSNARCEAMTTSPTTPSAHMAARAVRQPNAAPSAKLITGASA